MNIFQMLNQVWGGGGWFWRQPAFRFRGSGTVKNVIIRIQIVCIKSAFNIRIPYLLKNAVYIGKIPSILIVEVTVITGRVWIRIRFEI